MESVRIWERIGRNRPRRCRANASVAEGVKTEREKKDKRIANLEQLLGKREFELDWLSNKAKKLGL